eukprot:gnl/Dysnectes_brevis/2759_a3360_1337.p1 GENE.gnl/Dysnectes_brevis/2759_a3360_1337~~gnl/Dysnectes_brevis/2759_a3360_1337.p1  ORF type:complete len:370 (-),score=45.31 gnl/Dysnectes_brevis/2759_a3360_1337:48-1157(-)
MSRLVLIDNGNHSVKASVYNEPITPLISPNCSVKIKSDKPLIGLQTVSIPYIHQAKITRPCEQGFVMKWDLQTDIWEQLFQLESMKVETSQSSLLMTEPFFSPKRISKAANEVVFEYFQFESHFRGPPQLFSTRVPEMQDVSSGIIIDIGFSQTVVSPFVHGNPIAHAMKHLEIGGDALNGAFMKAVNKGTFDISKETILVPKLREMACSLRPEHIPKGILLPSSETEVPTVIQHMVPNAPIYKPGPESSEVPRLLFDPRSAHLMQGGVTHAVKQALQTVPPVIAHTAPQAVLVTGGVCKTPGLVEELTASLKRELAASTEVRMPSEDLLLTPLRGMQCFAETDFASVSVTRDMYREYGPIICDLRFFQ